MDEIEHAMRGEGGDLNRIVAPGYPFAPARERTAATF